ncbi:MAG: hypothetical protein K0U45_03880 [Alphaproteobacteria bacterium]|nr:hypothetical protein [Alphaproteobacteria bacterium]
MASRRSLLQFGAGLILGSGLGAGGMLLAGNGVGNVNGGGARNKSPQRVLNIYTDWRLNFPGIGEELAALQEQIARASGNQIVIKYIERGDLSDEAMINNINNGKADGIYSLPDFWQKQIPANLLYSAQPFGPTLDEYYKWLIGGEGQKLWQDLHRPINIMPLAVGASIGHMGGWFIDEILFVSDLRNRPIAAQGLPAMLYRAAGAKVYQYRDADIYTKLQDGSVEGAIVSDPFYEEALGLYKVATRYFTPGFQAPVQIYQLSLSLKRWQGLSISDQELIHNVVNRRLYDSVVLREIGNQQAIRRLVREHNVQLRNFTDDTIEQMVVIWKDLVAKLSKEDKKFAEIYQSMRESVLVQRNWHALGSGGYQSLRQQLFFNSRAPYQY